VNRGDARDLSTLVKPSIEGASARALNERETGLALPAPSRSAAAVSLPSNLPRSHQRLSRVIKRGVDLVLGTFLALVSLPLAIAITLAIKLTSSGSVLFKQTRLGLNGRPFTFLKFRSMVANAHELRPKVAHLNEADGPIFKLMRDPRVTPLGRFLRRSSLDELPQLWNVLTGDLSLVGPRPPLPEEVLFYTPTQRRRLDVKPGITCLWQVRGRSLLTFERWVELDLRYIDEWSLLLDFVILLETVPAVLNRRGAW